MLGLTHEMRHPCQKVSESYPKNVHYVHQRINIKTNNSNLKIIF